LAMSAVAAGAVGLMIEVHNDPEKAWCDGPQSLRPEAFDKLSRKARAMHEFMKTMED
ncbi:MAG: 3-deoxy-7-phosphoheptulonate synthase, partial [Oscillospiraceae bacterium]|nr:3-deoxy-7-phosphoheptulonate synthase [Oscillospiraceae bacterium]